RASSGKCSLRVRMRGLFHIKYYKNTKICHITSCDYPLIGTKPFRLKFPRSCLYTSDNETREENHVCLTIPFWLYPSNCHHRRLCKSSSVWCRCWLRRCSASG